MIRRGILKRQTAPPPNYIPGLARGDTGFTTGLENALTESKSSRLLKNLVELQKQRVANPNVREKSDFLVKETDFDQWNGFKANLFEADEYTDEDKEADQTYEEIERIVAAKVKHRAKKEDKPTAFLPLDAETQKEFSLADIQKDFGKDKSALANLSEADWLGIPDPAPRRKAARKNERLAPIVDSVLGLQTGLKWSAEAPAPISGTATNIGSFENIGQKRPLLENSEAHFLDKKDFGKAPDKILPSILAEPQQNKNPRNNAQSKTMSQIDRAGYLSQLQGGAEDFQIQDVQKARLLFRSVRESDPANDKGWLASARLEELNGRIEEARRLLRQGIVLCSGSEDLWLEFARLADKKDRAALLEKALASCPSSSLLWTAWINFVEKREEKIGVLRKAVAAIPAEENFWKQLCTLAESEGERRRVLETAVDSCPAGVDLWLAYAQCNDYKTARQVLNTANRIFQGEEPRIWIAAASLEEANGSDEQKIRKILSRGIKTLDFSLEKFSGIEFLLKQSLECETGKNFLTAKILLELSFEKFFFGDKNEDLDFERIEEEVFQCFDFLKAKNANFLAEESLFMFDKFSAENNKSYKNEKVIKNLIDFGANVKSPEHFLELAAKLISICRSEINSYEILESGFFEHQKRFSLEFIKMQQVYKQIAESAFKNAKSQNEAVFLIERYLAFLINGDCDSSLILSEAENFKSLPEIQMLSLQFSIQAKKLTVEDFLSASFQRTNFNSLSKSADFKASKLAAEIYLRINFEQEFERIWNEYRARRPEDFRASLELASGFLKKNRVFEARSLYSKLLEAKETDLDSWLKILEFERESPVVFKNLLQKALKKFPESERLALFSLEENSEALKGKLKELLKKFPGSAELRLWACRLFLKEGKRDKAKAWALQALSADTENLDVLAFCFSLGKLLERENFEKESAQSFREKLRLVYRPKGYLFERIERDCWLDLPLEGRKTAIFERIVEKFDNELTLLNKF